jgi:hypothetical protein
MMAGSIAQSPSITSTVDKGVGSGTQRRCGLLCVLSISSFLMLTPRQMRSSSSTSSPYTLPLPATTLVALDLPPRRQPTPRATLAVQSTSICASLT